MSLQAWTVELGNKPLDREMGNANLKLLMTALLSVVGSIAQDIHETLQLRQNLRKLIEAELDNPADDDSTPSLDENYVKTLQELNISSFKKNPYFTNTTVQHVFLPQCAVGNSSIFQDLSQFVQFQNSHPYAVSLFGNHNFCLKG